MPRQRKPKAKPLNSTQDVPVMNRWGTGPQSASNNAILSPKHQNTLKNLTELFSAVFDEEIIQAVAVNCKYNCQQLLFYIYSIIVENYIFLNS